MEKSVTQPEQPRWRVLLRRIVCVVSLLVFLVVSVSVIRSYNCHRLKQQGEVLIAAVEEYRTEVGAYPDDIEDVGIDLPVTCFGQWQYHRISQPLIVDGRIVGGVDGYRVSISTMRQPSLWCPYMSLSRWGRSDSWRIKTNPC